MGLLEQEIKELRQMNEKVINGEISTKELNARIAIYAQTEKRAKLILQAYAINAKFSGNQIAKLAKTQLIGDGSVIDLDTEIEKETIHCPDREKVVTRLDCKKFSETTGNLTNCQNCSNFKTTRRLLSKEKQT